jgi:hypothetical protein
MLKHEELEGVILEKDEELKGTKNLFEKELAIFK